MANLTREQALAEGYKRGILPPEVKAAYEEAQRRGLLETPQGDFPERPAMEARNAADVAAVQKELTANQKAETLYLGSDATRLDPAAPIPPATSWGQVRPLVPAIAGAGAGLMTGGMSLPASMGFSALMAAGGEGIAQVGDQIAGNGPATTADAAKRMAIEGALGAAGEFFPALIGGKMTAEGLAAKELAGKYKLPIPDTEFAEGVGPKYIQKVVGAFPMGRTTQQYYQKQMVDKLSGVALEFKDAVGRPALMTEEAVTKFGDALAGLKEFGPTYKPWNDSMKSLGAIPAPNLSGIVKDTPNLLKQMGWSPSSQEGQIIRRLADKIKSGSNDIGSRDMKYLVDHIWNNFNKNAGFRQDLQASLKDAMLADLDGIKIASDIATGKPISVGDFKRIADAGFGEVQEWFKRTPLAKKLVSTSAFSKEPLYAKLVNSGRADTAIKSMFLGRRTDELLSIQKVLAKNGEPEAFDMMTVKFIEGLFDQSISVNPSTGKSVFKPAQFSSLMEKYGPMLEKISPTTAASLREMNELAVMAAKGAQGAEEGFIQSVAGGFGMTGTVGAGMVIGGPVYGVLVPNGAAAAMAWASMPKGTVGKILKRFSGAVTRAGTIGGGGEALEAVGLMPPPGRPPMTVGGQEVNLIGIPGMK